jgi:cation diffusion facilitator family transporter
MAAGGDSIKVVIAALVGNGLIAIAKFVAAGLSGSVAMLAEAVHSVADTSNQALLLLGIKLSKKSDPERYPLGRAKEVYFWSFIVSLMLFFLGGVYAIYEGVHKLTSEDEPPGSLVVPVVVLGLSICFEAGSFWVAWREFNRTRRGRPFVDALFRGRDPTIPVVLLEDTGALAGLVVAIVAVAVSGATGSTVADGVGSLVIGILLCGIGVVLAFETHSLIIGEGVPPDRRARAIQLATEVDGVDAVTQFLSLHLGPSSVLVALKVRFSRGMQVEEVEAVTNRIEERVRSEIPEMERIFVEADGRYDARFDPKHNP